MFWGFKIAAIFNRISILLLHEIFARNNVCSCDGTFIIIGVGFFGCVWFVCIFFFVRVGL